MGNWASQHWKMCHLQFRKVCSCVWLVVRVGAHNIHIECGSFGEGYHTYVYIYTSQNPGASISPKLVAIDVLGAQNRSYLYTWALQGKLITSMKPQLLSRRRCPLPAPLHQRRQRRAKIGGVVFTRVHVCMSCIYIYIYIYTHDFIVSCNSLHIHTCMHTYTHTCLCVCECICYVK